MERRGKFYIYLILGILIPFIIFLLRQVIPDDQSVLFFAALSILILSYLSVMYHDIGNDLDNGYQEVKNDIIWIKNKLKNQAEVRSINEANWYDEFEPRLKNAEDHVYISYLHNEDPRESQDTQKVEYYSYVGNIIKRKSKEGVEIRRVIRGIPALEDWIDDLIDEHEGTSYYSLGCIPDTEPNVVNKPHISVQLVDDDTTYFVAVGEQKEGTYPRDMFVQSEEMNTQWDRYYHSLWKSSWIVLDRGNVNQENLESLKEHIDKIRH